MTSPSTNLNQPEIFFCKSDLKSYHVFCDCTESGVGSPAVKQGTYIGTTASAIGQADVS